MSEAPIIKAFKELEEIKAFKDWGTQTEKDDATTSNCLFLYSQTCRGMYLGFIILSIKAFKLQ